MKHLIIAKIIVLILLINCQSVPVQDTVVNQLIEEAKIIYKDDPKLVSVLNACSLSMSEKNTTIQNLLDELDKAKSEF